ncbi:response regulator transcription factor [Alkalibacter saccharofermentans]|uniref:Stage 0 sporulation protein A homolog n=1 Tax=Alkalibacter saccharofermentans DSM 14828 TaxID=1120975 RepID=A0A1M4XMH0_9FIRM|nr:response regulator transcription factor [Alkalibacter saccharofermentans]SHE94817.1 DNA-binding response regulator, OmpR family, contains REC and winged-helix (wHTH) domain [Alkalibacter saccharofermentans DSM 14828]
MKKIFVVEDEENLRNLIEAYLVKEGFMVVTAQNGLEAVEKWRDSLADIIIMDIMMPGLDGYEVLDYIRKDSKVPVVFLTAKRELEDKIKGFETGADDYLVKPFSMKELVMRTKAILKRSGNQEDYLQTYGELTIDLIKMEARVSGELIELSRKEYELLAYLAKNINIPISRGKLLDGLWGIDFEGDDRVVDTAIKRLRKKLGAAEGYIKTVRGLGYKFEV